MEFNEYQELAMRTAGEHSRGDEQIKCALMGLSGETGEINDLFKKVFYHGHPQNGLKDRVIKECGDILWYIALMCDAYDVTFEQVAQANIAKLKKRYPDGFSSEASMNRTI